MDYIHKAKAEKLRTSTLHAQMEARRQAGKAARARRAERIEAKRAALIAVEQDDVKE